MNNQRNDLLKLIEKGKIQENVPLARYTTMKIGGPARFLVETGKIEEIKALIKYCQRAKLPFFILGGGSNVVFADRGFKGVVLKLAPVDFKIIKSGQSPVVEFGAGYFTSLAAVKMTELGFSGFESLCGLPGTIGGAIYQNSKWPKGSYQISDNLLSVTYIDDKQCLVTKKKADLQFAYGFSSFQKENYIIVRARFGFIKKDPKLIKAQCEEVVAYRLKTQPYGVYTAGCVFKNIGKLSAGRLLDEVNLKSVAVGQMRVSNLHANFFINMGKAKAKDYLALVKIAKKRVKQKFNLDLKEEVRFVK